MVATQTDPLLGKTFGQVTLSQRLGAGAMGVVYRGWHQRLEREVAVKMLIANREDKPTYRERFLREGRAAAKVRNEHVVQVLDAGQEGTTAFLVMEFVNGRSLGDLLDEAKILAPEVVTRLGAGIALGLAAIHAQGIVHRDIKPDNILVGADRKPRVADLGLAKQLNDPELQRLTATGMVVGTPLYVSPEGIRDPATISDRSDVYSLGATLYHMLSGRPPFQGDTPYEVMHGHLQGRLTPLRTLRPEIPEWLARVVERCLNKEPAKRPDAAELADALMRGAAAEAGRKPVVIAAALAALLVLGGGLWWWTQTRTPITETLSATAPIPDDAGTIRLEGLPNGVRLQIDGQTIADPGATVAVSPGERRLFAEIATAGPLRRATGTVTVATGNTVTWNPTFATIPVSDVRLPVPGQGLLLVDGRARGTDPVFAVDLAGSYHLGRWDGSTFTHTRFHLADDGKQTLGTWIISDHPTPEVLWTRIDAEGKSAPAHHVVSWWMAEHARAAAGLPAPVGWAAQGATPERPAVGVPAAIVQATLDITRGWGTDLPDRANALALARQLGASVWCRDQGALARVGGLGGLPVLVLVPAE